jgi:hypothetical protein
MPKKEHIGYTRLNQKQLNNYAKGKSFNVKPVDHNDESNTVVKLHFKAKKNLSKLNKNLSMGKGVRVNPHELEDMQMHTGDGIFDSLKGVMNSKITKGIVKAAAPEIGNILGNKVQSLTNSQLAGNMTKSLVNEGSKQMTSGSGFLNNILKSKITKGIVKAAAPEIGNILGNEISSLTGSQLAGHMTKSLIKESAKEMTGSGIRSKRGGSFAPLGGSINANQYVGIGPNVPSFSNPSERMAYVRSHRKSNGVVMQ